jgi:hypothetical protein
VATIVAATPVRLLAQQLPTSWLCSATRCPSLSKSA